MSSKGSESLVGVKDKTIALSDKMNTLADKLSQNLDLADELTSEGDEIVKIAEINTDDFISTLDSSQIINLKNMVQDFQYIRSTLKENADNGRRVLNAITLELLESDGKTNGNLVTSFAELNRAVADNMKLYIIAYKDISNTLLNINKLNSTNDTTNKPNTQAKEQKTNSAVTTAEILKSF